MAYGVIKMNKVIVIISALIFLLVVVAYSRRGPTVEIPQPTPTVGVSGPEIKAPDIQIIAQDLQIPWEVVFLPTGEMLLTERPGTLLKIGKERQIIQIEGVAHVGEGGLLGMVIHPDFSKNRFIYLYLTTRTGGNLTNRVERYRLDGNILSDRKIIIEGINGGVVHDGGRMAFGPDGYLYISTGDAGDSNSAQDNGSLNGKILRLTDDGLIPVDNPFGNAVYSSGHRNVQGIAWDSQGRLWATEHGPSGAETGNDELNLIEKGKNYGWPLIRGNERRDGMVSPIIQSGTTETWAPSGAVFFDGSILFAGLRGETLYKAEINDTQVTLKRYFQGQFGRLRTVTVGPDGFLYILTNNTDGRGNPREGDDKLIKINPKVF